MVIIAFDFEEMLFKMICYIRLFPSRPQEIGLVLYARAQQRGII